MIEKDRVAFAHGARFLNHMVVAQSPIAWDFARWRRALESYRIDGRPVYDGAPAEDSRGRHDHGTKPD